MLQSEFLDPDGSWKPTETAPPHWVLVTVEPWAEQEAVCLQTEPSAMPYMKSISVSYETDTCISVMEKALSEPQEIFGPLSALLLTLPVMHLF